VIISTELQNIFTGALGSFILLVVLMPLAKKTRLVDSPDKRKQHVGEVPLVGGIAITLALFINLFLMGQLMHEWVVISGSVLLLLTGILDDYFELSTLSRFIPQAAAVLLMGLVGGVVIAGFGELLMPGWVIGLGVLAIPVTVFSTVGIINAYNMADGVDGLAGSLALVTLLSLALLYGLSGQKIPHVLLIVAGAIVGFLSLNMRLPWQPKARVFLGDAGSMVLGFIITWYLVVASQGDHRVMAPVTALWLVAIPLFDTISVMTRRISSGSSPFKADRHHLHHALLEKGISHVGVQWLLVLFSIVFALIGLAGVYWHITEAYMFYGILILGVIYHVWISSFWREKKI